MLGQDVSVPRDVCLAKHRGMFCLNACVLKLVLTLAEPLLC